MGSACTEVAWQHRPLGKRTGHLTGLAVAKQGQADVRADLQAFECLCELFGCGDRGVIDGRDDVAADEKLRAAKRDLELAAVELRFLSWTYRLDDFDQDAVDERKLEEFLELGRHELRAPLKRS